MKKLATVAALICLASPATASALSLSRAVARYSSGCALTRTHVDGQWASGWAIGHRCRIAGDFVLLHRNRVVGAYKDPSVCDREEPGYAVLVKLGMNCAQFEQVEQLNSPGYPTREEEAEAKQLCAEEPYSEVQDADGVLWKCLTNEGNR